MSTPTSWWNHAACRGLTHLFYPPDGAETAGQLAYREHLCRSTCAECPVLVECRAEERSNPNAYAAAFMAGRSPDERNNRRLREPRLTENQVVGLPDNAHRLGRRVGPSPLEQFRTDLGKVRVGDVQDREVREWLARRREQELVEMVQRSENAS